MKRLNFIRKAILAAALFLFVSNRSFGQIPGGAPAGINATMMKLFGEHPAFTADIEAHITAPSHQPLNLTMTMACLDNKVRSEVDMNKMSGKGMPAQALAQMKQMGMDHVVSIIRPDKKTIVLIYPNLRAYTELPLAEGDTGAAAKEPKMEKAALGKETVEGHPCVKSRVTFTDDKKQKQEILVWNATDLKNFPVKMQMDTAGSEVTMIYKHVQFARPAARQFEPPAGYAKYSDQMQIIQKAAQRLQNGNSSASQKH